MTDAMTGNNGNGTTAGIFPSGASADSFYGQTGDNLGFTDNGLGRFEFRGLDPSRYYTFTFFASRTNVSDRRDTDFLLSGAGTQTVTLDAANNVSDCVIAHRVSPDASGVIALQVSAGTANNSSKRYYYLGAVRVTVGTKDASPRLYAPVPFAGGLFLDWTGAGVFESSDALESGWTPRSVLTAPCVEPLAPGQAAFYRLSY